MIKRTLLLAAALLLVAGGAFAYIPIFPVSDVTVRSGEEIIVPVAAGWSGLDPTWTQYHFEFFSGDESVALVEGVLQSPDTHGTISITGVGPGDTSVRLGPNSIWPWLRIHVVCGPEPAVIAVNPAITAREGQAVSIQAITPVASRAVFLWYSGRIGDFSHPITDGGAGPQLRLKTETAGTSYVWVLARTPCSESMAEFRIDVVPLRRRSVGG
ncbi:MAG TPA: hypothetical protein VNN08_12685 [Thermoanaerobaculia bacterium]|nr:hypothetical protein [Thermoanaerobaculia bacterium]